MPSLQLPTDVSEDVISHDRWFLDRIATHIRSSTGGSTRDEKRGSLVVSSKASR
jgi:ATPase subunit of ABC transporter with duplicated ATPase domains